MTIWIVELEDSKEYGRSSTYERKIEANRQQAMVCMRLEDVVQRIKYYSRLSIPFESPDSPSLILFFRSLDGELVEPGSANGGGRGGCGDAGFVDCEPEGDEECASR